MNNPTVTATAIVNSSGTGGIKYTPSLRAIIFSIAMCIFGITLSVCSRYDSNISDVYSKTYDSINRRSLRSSNSWEAVTSFPKMNNTTAEPLIFYAQELPECAKPDSWVSAVHPAILYTIIIVLVLFSAFFSGLTLALMGLDTTGLEIVMSGDDAALARAATRIYPVRKNGNLLLCTLLLGNVAVNTLLGILMADLTSGTVGFITSTAMIVIFGEIIPQATFSRYALQVGEKAIPLMNVIICLFYIIAKPLALSSVEKNELENALGSKTVKTIKVDERGREYSSYEVFNGDTFVFLFFREVLPLYVQYNTKYNTSM